MGNSECIDNIGLRDHPHDDYPGTVVGYLTTDNTILIECERCGAYVEAATEDEAREMWEEGEWLETKRE
jgi:hypothetical protein